MTADVLWIILARGVGLLFAFAVVTLLVTGLVGRRRPTRPACSACQRPLDPAAQLPQECPGCRASLLPSTSVRFTGHRIWWRPTIAALVIIALNAVPLVIILIAQHFSSGPARVGIHNGIAVMRNVTPEAFENATAGRSDPTWQWIEAHLTHDVLPEALRRRAAVIALEAFESGARSDPLCSVLRLLSSELTEAELARVIAVAGPGATVVPQGNVRSGVHLEVTPAPFPLFVRMHQSVTHSSDARGAGDRWLSRITAVTEVRMNGVPVRPLRPTGRVMTMHQRMPIELPASPEHPAESLVEIEVDVVTAYLWNPPPSITEWGLPGPPEQWPGVAAVHRETLRVQSRP